MRFLWLTKIDYKQSVILTDERIWHALLTVSCRVREKFVDKILKFQIRSPCLPFLLVYSRLTKTLILSIFVYSYYYIRLNSLYSCLFLLAYTLQFSIFLSILANTYILQFPILVVPALTYACHTYSISSIYIFVFTHFKSLYSCLNLAFTHARVSIFLISFPVTHTCSLYFNLFLPSHTPEFSVFLFIFILSHSCSVYFFYFSPHILQYTLLIFIFPSHTLLVSILIYFYLNTLLYSLCFYLVLPSHTPNFSIFLFSPHVLFSIIIYFSLTHSSSFHSYLFFSSYTPIFSILIYFYSHTLQYSLFLFIFTHTL